MVWATPKLLRFFGDDRSVSSVYTVPQRLIRGLQHGSGLEAKPYLTVSRTGRLFIVGLVALVFYKWRVKRVNSVCGYVIPMVISSLNEDDVKIGERSNAIGKAQKKG